ncbi:MAG TPA: DUF177 domain-containing protein [Microvirga sp.]|jgi:uncharacterized metal-binding protein YceD (DUF177 family)
MKDIKSRKGPVRGAGKGMGKDAGRGIDAGPARGQALRGARPGRQGRDETREVLSPDAVGPLSRLVDVSNVPPHGTLVHVQATEEECAALAKDFNLPVIRSLKGEYRVTGSAKGVHVAGAVTAEITQTCVVTLEDFDSTLREEVEVDFAEPHGMPAEPPTEMHEYEPPDEIVNGHVDFGALTAEFLALGLDPYPRKPGVDFDYKDKGDERDNPFAALGKLKGE